MTFCVIYKTMHCVRGWHPRPLAGPVKSLWMIQFVTDSGCDIRTTHCVICKKMYCVRGWHPRGDSCGAFRKVRDWFSSWYLQDSLRDVQRRCTVIVGDKLLCWCVRGWRVIVLVCSWVATSTRRRKSIDAAHNTIHRLRHHLDFTNSIRHEPFE